MDLTNHFLLSMPGLNNSWFDKTITYVFEHNEDGAFGFVINRPASLLAGEVYDQLEIDCIDPADRSVIVYEGGPVDKERGFVLFPTDEFNPTHDRITKDIDEDSSADDADFNSEQLPLTAQINRDSQRSGQSTGQTQSARTQSAQTQSAQTRGISRGIDVTLAVSTDILFDIGRGKGPNNYLLLLGYAGWEAGQLEDEMTNNTWLTCEASHEILFAGDASEKLNLAASSLGIQFDLMSAEAGHA